MDDARWYVAERGQRLGPFSGEQLAGMAAEGRFGAVTRVWRKGFDGWLRAGEVPELAAILADPAEGASAGEPAAGAEPDGGSAEGATAEESETAGDAGGSTGEDAGGTGDGGLGRRAARILRLRSGQVAAVPGGGGAAADGEAPAESPGSNSLAGPRHGVALPASVGTADVAPAASRKPLPGVIRVGVALAALGVATALILHFHAFRVSAARPNPFLAAIPPWAADLAGWGLFYLASAGAVSALGLFAGARWASLGQLVFWAVAGALTGAAAGLCPAAAAREARSFAGSVPLIAPALAGIQAALGGVPLATVAASAVVAAAVLAVVLLLWRLPVRSAGAAGDDGPRSRALCRLALLAWGYLFAPWWILNALAHGLRRTEAVLWPGGDALGTPAAWAVYRGAFYTLPAAALIGAGAVLGRWRPRRGSPLLARALGTFSVLLLGATLAGIPAHAWARRRFFPPPETPATAPGAPETPAPAPTPVPAPPPPPERGRAGLAPEASRLFEEADRKRAEALAIVSAVQDDVKAGRPGTRARLLRAQALLGEAIDALARVQDGQDARGEAIPAEVMRAIRHATEAQKVVRPLLLEAR